MSPTMTVTVPRTRMHRSKTLSLAAPRAPSFTTLPTELILDILERALLASPKTGHTSVSPLPLFAGVTRLRIAEPAETWTAPRAMLAQLGPLAQLTHLHLARRAGANEDNDITFAADVAMLLRARPSLKVLAVSVFPPYLRPLPGTVSEADMDVDDEGDTSEAERACRDSHIWALLAEIARVDRRLVLRCGAPDAWRKQWAGVEVVANASGPADFWGTVARAQRKGTL